MKNLSIYLCALAAAVLTACGGSETPTEAVVLVTSEAGQRCDTVEPVTFIRQTLDDAVVVNTDERRQQIDGFGVSLTESSAFVLACISEAERTLILNELFGQDGANFSAVRTQIGASDFSVEGCYSLAEQEGDTLLASFTLDRDREGFPRDRYPQVVDEHYDLFNLMKDVAAIKQSQTDKAYRIIASPWTAPAWMKDNGRYYERENGVGRGGSLLPQYYQTFADYFVKYLEAWRAEGVEIWAVTPENEPMGNDGGWESMDFPPAAEAEFIGRYLGPTLERSGFADVKILGFDQNTFESGPYTAAIYGDPEAGRYTAGMALHWYGSTTSCFPHVLDSLHALYPDKLLFHTEGCIDNLGCPVWGDVIADPEGFMESGWFMNDDFWFTPSATDWAYSTPWWPELHPKYAPVHRLASYVIDGLNHWLTGLTEWNAVLDSVGGPNHVGNYAGAPVMIDYQNNRTYFTPYYYVLCQLSRTMRPGDTVLGVTPTDNDALHVCATVSGAGAYTITILNTAAEPQTLPLQIGAYGAHVSVPANAVQTVIVKIPS